MSENIVVAVAKHPLQSDAQSEFTTDCDKCGATLRVGSWPFCPHEAREVGFLASKIYPFTTTNFTGKPIEVRDASHERQLMAEHGVVKRDDVAWIDKEYLGYNHKTGKQEYKEGRGVGMPGCWV